jgi:hypothetical protein
MGFPAGLIPCHDYNYWTLPTLNRTSLLPDKTTRLAYRDGTTRRFIPAIPKEKEKVRG